MLGDVKAPEPVVQVPSRKDLPIRTRVGRGFSIPELNAVGLDVKKARKLGLRVDERRSSCHEENVKLLRDFMEKITRKI